MKQLFASATIKLTVWYMLILTFLSLLFSVIIYQVSSSELDTRLNVIQERVQDNPNLVLPDNLTIQTFRQRQSTEGEASIFIALLYANLAVMVLSGAASYLLARRSLKPIEESHEAQSRFTSDASHELRTPLAIMKSELEVALRDTNISKAYMREILESNLEEVNRLSDLSRMLLQLSRQEFSEMKVETILFSQLVRQAVKASDKAGKRIKLSTPRVPVRLEGNKSSLTELLMILLDNAERYSPKNSQIIITLTSQSKTRTITIENEGKGITAKDLPHIFDRFYRGDKSRTSGQPVSGFGLGLSLAKKITDIHDGSIEISSTPGVNTTITVTLPKSL